MKVEQDEILTANIGKEAKGRLRKWQTLLRKMGYSRRETTPGKLIQRLVLADDALSLLKKEFAEHTEQ